MKLNLEHLSSFISQDELLELKDKTHQSIKKLEEGTGKGSDFLGWLDLPIETPDELIADIKQTAAVLRDKIDFLIVIGIGGSYLGSKAIISALSHQFEAFTKDKKDPFVIFAGHNIGEDYIHELLEVVNEKEFALVVISKSGTTTEPAIAFRILKNQLEEKYGSEEAATRIVAITDKEKGALRTLAAQSGYKTFIIPDDAGGRFSGLTPVGLLPIAVAGYDIEKLLDGARRMHGTTGSEVPFDENPAALYAAARTALYRKKKKIEILANYDNRLVYFSEWWKQLFGESEGKDKKGIFPASVSYTTDLHSMGQYVQEGERTLFETIISVGNQHHTVHIPEDEKNLDSLNYLAGKRIDEVNKMAGLGTILAHIDGGVPNILIEIPRINEFYLGELIYFFEKACGISGYLLGVNPFNQPGVEAYKKNMFALLEKPGFEKETQKIKNRLQ